MEHSHAHKYLDTWTIASVRMCVCVYVYDRASYQHASARALLAKPLPAV